jgi:hypothetical protein
MLTIHTQNDLSATIEPTLRRLPTEPTEPTDHQHPRSADDPMPRPKFQHSLTCTKLVI